MHVTCIAEIASAHDGQLDKALRLVDVACEAGADAVKAVYWSSADRLADRRHAGPEYREIYRRYQPPLDWIPKLAERAHDLGLQFGCSVYLPEDVPVIAALDVDFLKLSSFECLAVDMRDALDAQPKPVIVSAGMCNDEETRSVLRWRTVWRYNLRRKAAVLHCVSQYPADMAALNLATIRKHGLNGFSDHTASITTGAYAVSMGAHVLETHIRLDDTDLANPDYAPALCPRDYWWYVAGARHAGRCSLAVPVEAVGDGFRAHQPAEDWARAYRVKA